MGKMTKNDIQKRQAAIWNEMDEIEVRSRKEDGSIQMTDADAAKYDALVRESAGLSARAKSLASGAELAQIRSNEDKSKELREMINDCFAHKRAANATTILAGAITTGDDKNINANLEAGGLIPVEILPIIDTKVPGVNLPDDLVMLTGVTGTQVIPYSINDVKFTVEGEVTKVAEQSLDFANIKTNPQRVAASVPVSRRAVAQAAFDILGFLTFKFQKGWAIFRAQHVYGHGAFAKLDMPFAKADVVELALDENIGKNLAIKIAEMYDLGFEGDPELIMDKVTEVNLSFQRRIPGQIGDKTVIEDGKCLGFNYKVSPYIDYKIASNGVATPDTGRFIGIGHFGYLQEQQHGEFRFNIDGTSQANFDRNTVGIGMSTDYSLTDLSKLVNGGDANDPHKPQAFKLIKLVEPVSSNVIGD